MQSPLVETHVDVSHPTPRSSATVWAHEKTPGSVMGVRPSEARQVPKKVEEPLYEHCSINIKGFGPLGILDCQRETSGERRRESGCGALRGALIKEPERLRPSRYS